MGNSARNTIIGGLVLACLGLAGCTADNSATGKPAETTVMTMSSATEVTSTPPATTVPAAEPTTEASAPAETTTADAPVSGQPGITRGPAPRPPIDSAPAVPEASQLPAPVATQPPVPPPAPTLPAPYLMNDYNPLAAINAKRAALGYASVVQGASAAAVNCALHDLCSAAGLQWGGARCSGGGDLNPYEGAANFKSVVWAKAYRSDQTPVGCQEAIAFSSFG
jgi:hypothetical protein